MMRRITNLYFKWLCFFMMIMTTHGDNGHISKVTYGDKPILRAAPEVSEYPTTPASSKEQINNISARITEDREKLGSQIDSIVEEFRQKLLQFVQDKEMNKTEFSIILGDNTTSTTTNNTDLRSRKTSDEFMINLVRTIARWPVIDPMSYNPKMAAMGKEIQLTKAPYFWLPPYNG